MLLASWFPCAVTVPANELSCPKLEIPLCVPFIDQEVTYSPVNPVVAALVVVPAAISAAVALSCQVPFLLHQTAPLLTAIPIMSPAVQLLP